MAYYTNILLIHTPQQERISAQSTFFTDPRDTYLVYPDERGSGFR